MIFLIDARALYPSLDLSNTKEAIRELVLEFNIGIKHFDAKQLVKIIIYVKEKFIKHDITSTIPRRQVEIDGTCGRKPIFAYLNSDT